MILKTNFQILTKLTFAGWATGDNIGTDKEALDKDYLSGGVWDEPANYIAIVRHQNGVVEAVKVFKFKHWATSLSTRFTEREVYLKKVLNIVITTIIWTSCYDRYVNVLV